MPIIENETLGLLLKEQILCHFIPLTDGRMSIYLQKDDIRTDPLFVNGMDLSLNVSVSDFMVKHLIEKLLEFQKDRNKKT